MADLLRTIFVVTMDREQAVRQVNLSQFYRDVQASIGHRASKGVELKQWMFSDAGRRNGREQEGEVSRYLTGYSQYSEVQDAEPLSFPWPWSDKMPEFAPAFRPLIDIADIPGHPPVHQPGEENPLPEHLIHDVRECDWCAHHPAIIKQTTEEIHLRENPPVEPDTSKESTDPEDGILPVPESEAVIPSDIAVSVLSPAQSANILDNLEAHTIVGQPMNHEWGGTEVEGSMHYWVQPQQPTAPGQSLHAPGHVVIGPGNPAHPNYVAPEMPEPLVTEADPQLEALLAEEEAIIAAGDEASPGIANESVAIQMEDGSTLLLTQEELDTIGQFLQEATEEEIQAITDHVAAGISMGEASDEEVLGHFLQQEAAENLDAPNPPTNFTIGVEIGDDTIPVGVTFQNLDEPTAEDAP